MGSSAFSESLLQRDIWKEACNGISRSYQCTHRFTVSSARCCGNYSYAGYLHAYADRNKSNYTGQYPLFLGIAAAHPQLWGKTIALIIFVLFTNPLSSHVLARALHNAGARSVLVVDELEEAEK